MKPYSVYLGACEQYDSDKISQHITAAIEQIPLSKTIEGKIVIKPNLCMVHPKVTSGSHTRLEVAEGIIKALHSKSEAVERIDFVEKSGLGVTTAGMYRWSGYKALEKKYNVKCRAMEEGRHTKVVLKNGKVHSYITIASEMAERDFLVFAPKFKTNVLSHAYTGALKLNIGTIDSKERLFHHNKDLHLKIVDILEAANPDLIVSDGITLSFGGNQMTQPETDLGVIAVSTNAVAHDMVCSMLLNLDYHNIEHIQEAIDRGYGPDSMDEIEIMGDYPVERARKMTAGLDFGFMPVDQFKSPFQIHSGSPYCTGGCQGIFLDWLHMVKDRKPGLIKRFPKLKVLIGKVEEAIEGKRILLVGNCAMASPKLKAGRIVRIKGCPPSHKRIVWDMMVNYGLLAPLVRPSLIIDGFVLYPIKKVKGWFMNKRFTPGSSS